MHRVQAQRGVTLIEACVVTAVTVIVASSVTPGIGDFIARRRLEGTAARLAADVQFARAEAVMRGEPRRVEFQRVTGGSCYVVHDGIAGACRCDIAGTAACVDDRHASLVAVQPATDGVSIAANVASIVFDPQLGTSTPAATLMVQSSRGQAIHHVVNLMGRIRTCAPAGSAYAGFGLRAC